MVCQKAGHRFSKIAKEQRGKDGNTGRKAKTGGKEIQDEREQPEKTV